MSNGLVTETIHSLRTGKGGFLLGWRGGGLGFCSMLLPLPCSPNSIYFHPPPHANEP